MTIDPAIAALLAACAALLFAGAAVHKLRDLRRFDEIFTAYGLLPLPPWLRLSRAVTLLEAAVAAGLLLAATRTAAAYVGIVLLLAYAGAIALNLRRGRRDLACGCGGPDDRRPDRRVDGRAEHPDRRTVGPADAAVEPAAPGLTDALTIGCGTAAGALVYLCLEPAVRPHGPSFSRTADVIMTALAISNVVLWVVVLALLTVVLALVRQVGVLHERIAPAGALMINRGLTVGEQAPAVDVVDLEGRGLRLGAARADGLSTLILFVSPTCPVCESLLPVIRSSARDEAQWLQIVLASDGQPDSHPRVRPQPWVDGVPLRCIGAARNDLSGEPAAVRRAAGSGGHAAGAGPGQFARAS